ncbi:MAG: lytic murein transglycosylase [Mesorhizobium sp.]|nr:MAG: lytic murein transglycosylase [Mesorhizobium sp.]
MPGISPSRGGDRLTATPHLVLQHPRLRPERCEGVISPLEGEMPGRAEGGRRR